MVFPTFFNLNLNFAIRRSSLSHSQLQVLFLWLYRASPSLAANNIISLILVLTMWWCPCVESSLVLLEEGLTAMTIAYSWQHFVSLCPASFCTPRPNLPITPDISWLPTFAFQSTMMKRTSLFLMSVLEGLVGLHRIIQLQLLQHSWLGHWFGLLWYWMICLGNQWRSFSSLWDWTQVLHGNPLQYSSLENPLDRGTWQATVHGVARVGHDLESKLPLHFRVFCWFWGLLYVF